MTDTTLSTRVTKVTNPGQVLSHEILVNTPRVIESPGLSALRQAVCMTKVNSTGPLAGAGLDQVCDILSVKIWFWGEGHILGNLSLIFLASLQYLLFVICGSLSFCTLTMYYFFLSSWRLKALRGPRRRKCNRLKS